MTDQLVNVTSSWEIRWLELRPRPISKPGSSDKTPASNEQSQSILRDQIQAVKKRLAEVDKKYHFYETRTPSGARGTTAMLTFWDELLRQYNYLNRRLSLSSRKTVSANKEEGRKISLANDRRLAWNRGEGTSTRPKEALSKTTKAKPQCCVCYEHFPQKKIVRLQCSDLYCTSCLKGLFLRATKDQTLFPPKCCRKVIPLSLIQSNMSVLQRRAIEDARVKFTTKDAKYCSNKACGRFLPPSRIKAGAETARCASCRSSTCMICQSPAHGGECPKDKALQATLSLGVKNGWQRCYSCRHLVERTEGCPHIQCRCKAQFCYLCGMKWKTCSCRGG